MATEIYVWTGADWESCRGPQGATGPEGPTVVSADAVNVAKIGTDGKILVAQADLDTRYVNVPGDTMTGQLIVAPAVGPATPEGTIKLIGDNTNANMTIQRNSNTVTGHPSVRYIRTLGTTAAPLPIGNVDTTMGGMAWHTIGATGASIACGYIYCIASEGPTAANKDYINSRLVFSAGRGVPGDGSAFTKQLMTITTVGVGMNWQNITRQLEVGGGAIIRGAFEVTGNITSAGTAHSFAAASIPSSAVIGDVAFTPAGTAAAGANGSMRWDENFLYLRTGTAWKKVALSAL
jgi:hypothetical protein